jgi:hypothetical protein
MGTLHNKICRVCSTAGKGNAGATGNYNQSAKTNRPFGKKIICIGNKTLKLKGKSYNDQINLIKNNYSYKSSGQFYNSAIKLCIDS